jgi:hypothetical protein
MAGAARSRRLLRAGVDGSAEVKFSPVAGAQRQVDRGACAVRGYLGGLT